MCPPACRPLVASLLMSVAPCLFLARRSADRSDRRRLLGAGPDVVGEAVLLRLLGGEPAVTVGITLDLVERASRVEGDALLQHPAGVHHLLRLDGNVGGGTADAAGGLVHHDP